MNLKTKITKLPNGGELYEHSNGFKQWSLNHQYHREDGHAVEWPNGDKIWYINGKPHREDGPAIDYINGDKRWYLNGIQLDCTTQEEFERLMRLKAFW
jgi:hypothetical protein